MTELLDRAVQTTRRLPPDMQDEVARLMLLFVGDDRSVVSLNAEEEADLIEADEEVARGDLASDDEVRGMWAKHGL